MSCWKPSQQQRTNEAANTSKATKVKVKNSTKTKHNVEFCCCASRDPSTIEKRQMFACRDIRNTPTLYMSVRINRLETCTNTATTTINKYQRCLFHTGCVVPSISAQVNCPFMMHCIAGRVQRDPGLKCGTCAAYRDRRMNSGLFTVTTRFSAIAPREEQNCPCGAPHRKPPQILCAGDPTQIPTKWQIKKLASDLGRCARVFKSKSQTSFFPVHQPEHALEFRLLTSESSTPLQTKPRWILPVFPPYFPLHRRISDSPPGSLTDKPESGRTWSAGPEAP